MEQTTALDGFLDLCVELGDPYLESGRLATDTARSMSILTHVHMRYGVYLFLTIIKGDLVCFLGEIVFILIQDRSVFPSCLFFGRKRADMSYAYAVGWHSLIFESWLNLPIFHHERPIHLSLPI